MMEALPLLMAVAWSAYRAHQLDKEFCDEPFCICTEAWSTGMVAVGFAALFYWLVSTPAVVIIEGCKA